MGCQHVLTAGETGKEPAHRGVWVELLHAGASDDRGDGVAAAADGDLSVAHLDDATDCCFLLDSRLSVCRRV